MDSEEDRQNPPSPPGDHVPAEAMLYCPVCNHRLQEQRCKLICPRCGYYMSCADYY